MQRPIKFRAWNKNNKKMSKVSWINFEIPFIELDGYSANLTWGGLHPDCEIMQYTGLKDKNGKEIYEGDIIHLTYFNDDTEIFQVVWSNDYVRFELRDKYNGYWGFSFNNKMEVIGNVYEHPELMEGK